MIVSRSRIVRSPHGSSTALASCAGDGTRTEMGVESINVSAEGGSDAEVDEEDERRVDGK